MCYSGRIPEAYQFQDEVSPEQSENKDRNKASVTSLERYLHSYCGVALVCWESFNCALRSAASAAPKSLSLTNTHAHTLL